MSLAATSLKLPKTLKTRITRLAKRAGESPHAFMLRLLEEQVQATERFEQLHRHRSTGADPSSFLYC